MSYCVTCLKEEMIDAEEFLKEAAIMKCLRHPNVVQLVGVTTTELPYFIITEFMAKGNLLDYLHGPDGRAIQVDTLVSMAQQICSAMVYLESKGIIHRYVCTCASGET